MEFTLVRSFFAVFVVFLDIAVHPATASVGEPIFFKSSDTGPANFSFSLPPSVKDDDLTVIANPSGKEVLHVYGQNKYNCSSFYRDRIVLVEFKDRKISFSLKNVTADDAGSYTCREGSPGGSVIPDCGQTLYYIDHHNSQVNPPIVVCRGDYSPAHFYIFLPPSSLGLTNIIVHPSGKALISREERYLYYPRTEPEFTHRVISLRGENTSVSFSLRHVTRSDAGQYICREGSLTARIIRGCGQHLHYIDVEKPYVRMSGLAVEGKTFRLCCEVYVPDAAAELGLSFSFHWSRDGQPVSGQHGRVLTFHSVSQNDSGRYSCGVTEKTRDCGSSAESEAFSLNLIVPPSVSIRRHQHRPHLEIELQRYMTLTCEVVSAFPPVPSNGFSWSFSPSDSSPARPLPHTGDTLTIGPVTREDSGQYTCQARNDQDFEEKWRHGEDRVTVTVTDEDSYLLPPQGETGEGKVFISTISSVFAHSSPEVHEQSKVEEFEADAKDDRAIRTNGAPSMSQNGCPVLVMLYLLWVFNE